MTRISWGDSGSRRYETGLNRGVLYPRSGKGVAWNGLTSVSESPSGGAPTPYYYDGLMYRNEPSPEEYNATVSAYTYPEEFAVCDGTAFDNSGLEYDLQPRQEFGFSYRTLVGDDIEGLDNGYKIHIVYNALASPSEFEPSSLNDAPEAFEFSWGVTARPMVIPGVKSTPHLVVDTTKTSPYAVLELEKILYGTDSTEPRLPSPSEVKTLLDAYLYTIGAVATNGLSTLSKSGSNASDLTGDVTEGLYSVSRDTRLKTTDQLGVYRLIL